MKDYTFNSLVAIAAFLLIGTMLNAQALLDDDTLFIGSASGLAGEQIIIPVYLKTNHYVQGWQVPIIFGHGNTPVQCDSVSTVGTVMESWAFKAPFVNNYEWDNVQTCGIAGLVDWMGGSINPGHHLIMNLYYTIDQDPTLGAYSLDTTRASWTQGGPANAYIITVNGVSYITHVIQGEIFVTDVGVEEISNSIVYGLEVFPTVARIGEQLTIKSCNAVSQFKQILVYDAAGRVVERLRINTKGSVLFETNKLHGGVYFIAPEEIGMSGTEKIVLY